MGRHLTTPSTGIDLKRMSDRAKGWASFPQPPPLTLGRKICQLLKWCVVNLWIALVMEKSSDVLREDEWNVHVKVTFKILAVSGFDRGAQFRKARGYGSGMRNVLDISVAFMLDMPNPMTVVPEFRRGEVDVLFDSTGHRPTSHRERCHGPGT